MVQQNPRESRACVPLLEHARDVISSDQSPVARRSDARLENRFLGYPIKLKVGLRETARLVVGDGEGGNHVALRNRWAAIAGNGDSDVQSFQG